MDTTSVTTADDTSSAPGAIPVPARLLRAGGGIATAAIIIAGALVGSTNGTRDPEPAADEAAAVGVVAPVTAGSATGAAAVSGPDLVSDRIGGLAARLHDGDGNRIAGDLFLLMGREGSDARARLHDDTPYTHDRGEHAETRASNELAATVAGRLTGQVIQVREMTTAPGGGPSGGVVYAIAYLNTVSDGAFTGDLRVAATGQLSELGYVSRVDHLAEKTSAAHLAAADVFFTSAAPSITIREEFGVRLVGESVRDGAASGAGFHAPERVEQFRRWGADQRNGAIDGMDIVDTRHLIDVAAYFCGTGSDFACQITDELVRVAEERDRYRLRISGGADESERFRVRHEPTGDIGNTVTTDPGDNMPVDER